MNVREQLSSLHEQQKLDSQKLDFLVNSFTEYRTLQAKAHEDHLADARVRDTRIGKLEDWRTFLAGAWAVASVVAIALYEHLKTRLR